MAGTDLAPVDMRRLTPTQQAWYGRRGETIQVRYHGGATAIIDVPEAPMQRFKQFCYALDKRLIEVLGPAEHPTDAEKKAAIAAAQRDRALRKGGIVLNTTDREVELERDPSERPKVRDSINEWRAFRLAEGADPELVAAATKEQLQDDAVWAEED